MGIQINGQTDTVASTTSGGSVTLTSATLPAVSNISATRVNVSGVSTFTSGPVLIGSGTSTGTASQTLQVTGGTYISGNLGIGTTNPSATLSVNGSIESLSDTNSPNSITEGGQLTLRAPARAATKYRLSIDNHWNTAGTATSISHMRFFRENDSDASSGVLLATIDEIGRWRVPNQPAFDAVYTTPGGATATTTQYTEIVFNVANTNVGSYYSTSTGRFTAPVAGTYFFSMFGMSDVTNVVWYEIRKNGSLITYTHNPYTSVSGPAFRISGCSVILSLAVGDYVSAFTGGTTAGLYGGGNNHNGFCGYLIG
jgi:hypothetical protein